MARARKRRTLPTLIDRGLGLLEVIVPRSPGDDLLTMLPEGQRDVGGFWFPNGYVRPGDIFTPQQRTLQAKQRQVQKRRLRPRHDESPVVSGPIGRPATDAVASAPVAPRPSGTDAVCLDAAPTERPLPLPPPFSEAAGTCTATASMAPAASVSTARVARAVAGDPAGIRAEVYRPIVDSRKASD